MNKLKFTFTGMERYLYVKYGKKVFLRIDLVPQIAHFLKKSNSEVARTIKAGGLDVTVLTDTFEKNENANT
jgi:hypothetical protein